jgi:hypothetical protein
LTVRFVELVNYRMVETVSPTAEQLKLLESWLNGSRPDETVSVPND